MWAKKLEYSLPEARQVYADVNGQFSRMQNRYDGILGKFLSVDFFFERFDRIIASLEIKASLVHDTADVLKDARLDQKALELRDAIALYRRAKRKEAGIAEYVAVKKPGLKWARFERV